MEERNRRLNACVIVAVLLVALMYPLSYVVLRTTHILVHYENVVIPAGHDVASDSKALDAVYTPLRYAEVHYHRIRR